MILQTRFRLKLYSVKIGILKTSLITDFSETYLKMPIALRCRKITFSTMNSGTSTLYLTAKIVQCFRAINTKTEYLRIVEKQLEKADTYMPNQECIAI